MNSASGTAPLRIAVVGSGPAGFYTAESLLRQSDLSVEVDLFDRLPTPFGLVRFGVAPDHQKIKKVTRAFDRVANHPSFRFFGNVEIGRDLTVSDLERHYHQICFATGAQTDRRMGIPGEDLPRSHPATEFVAWYNGHPDYQDCRFDLSAERVVVVGVGNVAVDVARILCRTTEELEQTDIADYALDALRNSHVKEVIMLGRRGPAQAAFTNPEIRELGELDGAQVRVVTEEVELDPLSKSFLEESDDRSLRKKVEILQSFRDAPSRDADRTLTLRFLVSPVELLPGSDGGVAQVKLVHNELYQSEDGQLRPRATDRFEDLPADMVFRSVGYRGVPIPGLPFDDYRGVVPNDSGRVLNEGSPVAGLYVSGWIKRGPTGVIGTNKSDAAETVRQMISDIESGSILQPDQPDAAAVMELIAERTSSFLTYDDWRRIDRIEMERGSRQGRPRVKLDLVSEVHTVLSEAAKEDSA